MGLDPAAEDAVASALPHGVPGQQVHVVSAMQIDLDIHTFDPGDLGRLYAQDYVGEVYGSWPCLSRSDVYERSDLDLATFVTDLRNAVRLPLAPEFTEGMAGILTYAEGVALGRLRKAEKRRKAAERYGESHWSNSDFLAEVEAVAGEGRRRGKAYWFRCPMHSDQTPSFEVDPVNKVWRCWGQCNRGGGVVDFRRAITNPHMDARK